MYLLTLNLKQFRSWSKESILLAGFKILAVHGKKLDKDIFITSWNGLVTEKSCNLLIVHKGFVSPWFYEDPHIMLTPSPFFKFVQPSCSLCRLISWTEWVIVTNLVCYFLLNDMVDLLNVNPCYFSATGTLQDVSCNKTSVYWGLINMKWFFTGTLIWNHTHKQREARNTPKEISVR